MNAVAESCSRLCVDLLIVSLSFVLCVSESSVNMNEQRNGLFLLGVERQSVSAAGTRVTEILKECHDVLAMDHVGMCTTLELVDRQFQWRGLRGDTINYVKTCPVCRMMKSDSRAKVRLLQHLEIPPRKWAHVTTNLVTDLPESGGVTAIAVFVDKLTKIVHFSGTSKEVTAMEYPQIFVDMVFRLHGLPEVIISDRDPWFTGKFWRALFDLLGTDL